MLWMFLACQQQSASSAPIDTSIGLDPAESEDEQVDEEEAIDCPSVVALQPLDGTTDAALDAPVLVSFDGVVSHDDWEIAVDGVVGSVVLADDGLSASFVADFSWEASSSYTVTARVCEQTWSASFTTAEAVPQVDPDSIDGRTYVLRLEDADWVAPQAASLLTTWFPFGYLLLQVESVEAGLAVSAAGGSDDFGPMEQASCSAAADFGEVAFENNPELEAGPADQEVAVDQPGMSEPLVFEDMIIQAVFDLEGSFVESVVWSGRIDTRPIDPLVEDLLGEDACTIAEEWFTDQCSACRDGDEKCLPAYITWERGAYYPGLDIDEVYDPTVDPACN